MNENLNPIERLDLVLRHFIEINELPPYKPPSEILDSLNYDNIKEFYEILHKLEVDGYISSVEEFEFDDTKIRYYGSTFDGRLFYLSGGYKAKALADAAAAEQQRLEIERLKSFDVSSDQNQKRLNKLTSRLVWGTVAAAVVGLALLIWQIYVFYHPTPIPVDVKLKIEKSK